MPLTNTAIRNAKSGKKTCKLYDERGLYLEVSPNDGKCWRLKYRFGGKEKRLSLRCVSRRNSQYGKGTPGQCSKIIGRQY